MKSNYNPTANRISSKLAVSSESGAVLRSYDIAFKAPSWETGRQVSRKYKNRKLVDAFSKNMPECILTDYNMTLAGCTAEHKDTIDSDTALLLKHYIATAKDYWNSKGKKDESEPYLGIVSGNYYSYIRERINDGGFKTSDEKLLFKTDTSTLKTRWKKNPDSTALTEGSLKELYASWSKEMEELLKREFPKVAGTFSLYEREVQNNISTRTPDDPECTAALKRMKEYSMERFGLKTSDQRGGLLAMWHDSAEIVIPKHTKETGLEQARDLLGTDLSKIAYCGDSLSNDYEALRRTSREGGYAIVMSNEKYTPSEGVNIEPGLVEGYRKLTGDLKKKLRRNGVSFLETDRESTTAGAGMNEVLASATTAMERELNGRKLNEQ